MNIFVTISVLPLGRFLASIFSTLSCFPPFSLVPHMTILSKTHLACPIDSFPLVFFLSYDSLSPPLAGFHLRVYYRSNFSCFSGSHPQDFFLPVTLVVPLHLFSWLSS